MLGSLDEGTTVGVGGDLTAAAFLGASFRVDGPRRPAVEAPAAGAPTAVDRVLIGTRDELAEARIRIGSGPLAGTELSVSAAPGGRLVEAALLTYAAGSRQTLSVVMEEIRLRLRGKGIVLASAERPRQGPRGRDPESSR